MGSGPVSIRRYLTLIVLSALLPMGLLAAGLMYFLWSYQQDQRNQELVHRVRAMALVVEGELESTVERLRVLAKDPHLSAGALDAFHARLQQLLALNDDWGNIILLTQERQIINAAVAFNTELPEVVIDRFGPGWIGAGKPVTSDIFTARLRGKPTVAVGVPVLREDGPAEQALVVDLRLDYLGERLASILPPTGVAGVFDRQLRFIARTRDAAPYLGKPPGELLLDAMSKEPEGVIRSITREGERTFTGFRRLSNGWYIGVASPSAPSDKAFVRSLVLFGGAWLGILLLGLALTRFLTDRINRNVAATVSTATQLAAGEPAEFPAPTVTELASISEAVRSLFVSERRARAQAEHANHAKDEFLAILGHELRNPLAPIATALRVMQTHGSGEFSREREVIERQVNHMVRLVDDLLDVARIMRGGVELARKPLELSTIVGEAVESTRPLFARKGVKLTVSVPECGLEVNGDPVRLMQILSNLLTNAAKFTRDNGCVAVAASASDRQVILTVADDGVGMASWDIARVFELFIQGQQSVDRPRGGLGLGLPIARSLARLHGGDLTATSDGPGLGATFTLTLPRVSDPVAGEMEPARRTPVFGSEGLVLIVVDNVDAAVSLAELLGLWGLRTRMVHDGREVIAALEACAPDVVLLDIGLPGMDGYEVARAIRGDPRWHSLWIIALTGYGQASDRERSREAGFDAHLVKPVDFNLLETLLAQALGGKADSRSANRPGRSATDGRPLE